MRPGILFLVVGPSGVGKDTLIDGARAALAGSDRYVFAQRTITRPADAGGEAHCAVSEAEFDALEADGAFLISWSAHGLRYGLPAELSERLRAGHHVVANGSRASIAALAERVPRLVVVAVSTAHAAQACRIAERGRESADEVQLRLNRQVEWTAPAGVDVVLVTNDSSIEDGVAALIAALERASLQLRLVAFPIDSWRERIAYLPADSIIGARDYLGPERVAVSGAGRSICASIHVADAAVRQASKGSSSPAGGSDLLLAADEIGLSRQAFEELGLPVGAAVSLVRTPAPDSRAALRAKIRGKELTEAQYAMLLADIVAGRYTDSEVAAFLVAASYRLSDAEVVSLARVRASFMPHARWDEPMVVDKHSMGGIPGSRITMIVVPIVAAHGLAMPKTSSRAITSAAGTADAMEVLAKVDLDMAQFRRTVQRVRGCIAWNGRLNHSTLDDTMNAITPAARHRFEPLVGGLHLVEKADRWRHPCHRRHPVRSVGQDPDRSRRQGAGRFVRDGRTRSGPGRASVCDRRLGADRSRYRPGARSARCAAGARQRRCRTGRPA